MGFFKKLKQSASKSKLIKTASAHVQAGQIDLAVQEIYEYLQGEDVFQSILATFDATDKDIEAIISGIMMSGFGAEFRGHYVPVSSVLFYDTLAYCLRAERGQVTKAEAYFQVHEYFRSGALIFEPERAFH